MNATELAQRLEEQGYDAEVAQIDKETTGKKKAKEKKVKKDKLRLGDLATLVQDGNTDTIDDDVVGKTNVRVEKERDVEALSVIAETESVGREAEQFPEKKEVVLSDTDGTLPSNADRAIIKTVFDKAEQIDVESAERDKRLKYLAEDLSGDLGDLFGDSVIEPDRRAEIAKRFRENKVGPFISVKSEVQKMVTTLNDFMAMEAGYPKGWKALEAFLKRSGIEREDMEEARKRKGSSREVVKVSNEIKQTTEVQATKELKGKDEVVWYDGILDDLRWITYLDRELIEEKYGKKHEQFTAEELSNLRNLVLEEKRARVRSLKGRGVDLPKMSTDVNDKDAFEARQELRAAVEFLKGDKVSEAAKEIWADRKEAVAFLNDMGIGDFVGVEYLSGSKEGKRMESEERKEKEKEDGAEEEIREKLKDRPDLQLAWALAKDEKIRKTVYFLKIREKLRKVGISV